MSYLFCYLFKKNNNAIICRWKQSERTCWELLYVISKLSYGICVDVNPLILAGQFSFDTPTSRWRPLTFCNFLNPTVVINNKKVFYRISQSSAISSSFVVENFSDEKINKALRKFESIAGWFWYMVVPQWMFA